MARAEGLLDGRRDFDPRLRIDGPRSSGDGRDIAALVVRGRAYDHIECARQRAHDLRNFLVEGNPDHENPPLRAVRGLEAFERLPDTVRRVADVDDGQGMLSDDLEAAGPARGAEARSHRGLDPGASLVGPRL